MSQPETREERIKRIRDEAWQEAAGAEERRDKIGRRKEWAPGERVETRQQRMERIRAECRREAEEDLERRIGVHRTTNTNIGTRRTW